MTAPGIGDPLVQFADLNGDGRADCILLDDGGGLRAWLNRGGDGNGGWAYRGRIGNGNGAAPSQIRFADVDGDGRVDYLKSNRNTGALTERRNNGGDHDGVDGWGPWDRSLREPAPAGSSSPTSTATAARTTSWCRRTAAYRPTSTRRRPVTVGGLTRMPGSVPGADRRGRRAAGGARHAHRMAGAVARWCGPARPWCAGLRAM
ncbi:VCBS repeat-containing protein [Streptomyces sp. NPDC051132]|uniref:FG-GAP repeat domain-containing protein n=1 Tax=unclassified Streptomyces TaxID=2593676 RepID=UPI003427CF31